MIPTSFTPKKIIASGGGSIAPNKFVPQYRPALTASTSVSLPSKTRNDPPFEPKQVFENTNTSHSSKITTNTNYSSEELGKKSVHFENHSKETLPEITFNEQKKIPSSSHSRFQEVAQAVPAVMDEDENFDSSIFFGNVNKGRHGQKQINHPNAESIPHRQIATVSAAGIPASHHPEFHYLDDAEAILTEGLLDAEAKKRKLQQEHHSGKTTTPNTKRSRNLTTSSSQKQHKYSQKRLMKEYKPTFPMSILKLVHYRIPSELDVISLDKSIKHQRIITHLRLGPNGIPGIQFTNYDNRAVITALHPIEYGQSLNARYQLQLHDMILSVNHLDAKNASFEQLMKALHHLNEGWEVITSSDGSGEEKTAIGSNQSDETIMGSNERTSETLNANPSAGLGTANSNNIYVHDLNDPNYHSNRTSLKNAIIESMACVVFARIESVAFQTL